MAAEVGDRWFRAYGCGLWYTLFYPLQDWTQTAEAIAVKTVIIKSMIFLRVSFFIGTIRFIGK